MEMGLLKIFWNYILEITYYLDEFCRYLSINETAKPRVSKTYSMWCIMDGQITHHTSCMYIIPVSKDKS